MCCSLPRYLFYHSQGNFLHAHGFNNQQEGIVQPSATTRRSMAAPGSIGLLCTSALVIPGAVETKNKNLGQKGQQTTETCVRYRGAWVSRQLTWLEMLDEGMGHVLT